MPKALIVEDDPTSLSALAELVQREGFAVDTAKTARDARNRFKQSVPDVVLADLVLPDGNAMEMVRELGAESGSEFVLITGHASVETAVEALRMGASDYLTKPLDIARLKTVLANIARRREMQEEIERLRNELRQLGRFGALIGSSPRMGQVYDLLAKVASTNATVLIVGESGTGKDVVAQTLHELSRRRKEPFLPLNCGAISPNLIESELFGHERGSFTGADRTHRGYFERASGGTLFLDEITEMPLELQVKLLRVLETGTVMRLGGERPIEVDVRVIAATNRVPEEAVTDGKLREDLYYRLKVFPVALPPLRERAGDVELLASYFVQELNKTEDTEKDLTPEALARLRMHHWPGNVRELKNVLHRAYIMAEREITAESLPAEVGQGQNATSTTGAGSSAPMLHVPVGSSVADVEKRLIMATLDRLEGDKQRAAEILGISVKTLYNRLNAYKDEPAS
jgi:DNA-binding NtrC family response regulator